MDFKKVTVGFFAAVMAMTSVCFADPETPVTTDVPATDPVPETTTTAQPQREDTETTTTTAAQTWDHHMGNYHILFLCSGHSDFYADSCKACGQRGKG